MDDNGINAHIKDVRIYRFSITLDIFLAQLTGTSEKK